ncbi:hypothetical protein [Kaistia terrae]|uniref:Heme exporter protein CcmB n=1 Tax=Kaistia terrae TaxID=537017 RepID=A0ABW0PY77_9HYPH
MPVARPASSAAATTTGMPVLNPMLILVALTMASAVIGPVAGAAALRAGMD